jgi:predicted ABC-type ATPase
MTDTWLVCECRPFNVKTAQVALMTHAKAEGYEVTLVFVTTKDPELNGKRPVRDVLTNRPGSV